MTAGERITSAKQEGKRIHQRKTGHGYVKKRKKKGKKKNKNKKTKKGKKWEKKDENIFKKLGGWGGGGMGGGGGGSGEGERRGLGEGEDSKFDRINTQGS